MNRDAESTGTQSARDKASTIDAVLANHPFFAGMSKDHLEVLAANAMRVTYSPGTVIFRKGDPANRFYAIEEGTVSLEASRADAAPAHIQDIGRGDVLGWSWLFPPYIWEFDARAVNAVTAIFFYGTRLREACEKDHELGYELMKRMTAIVINRLQNVRRQLLDKT